MRAFLAFFVHASAAVFRESGVFSKLPAVLHGKDSDRTGVVVGYQNIPAGLVERKVAGTRAARGHLIQQPELARLPFDGKGADGAAFLVTEFTGFIYCVKILAVWVDRQKRRVCHFRDGSD